MVAGETEAVPVVADQPSAEPISGYHQLRLAEELDDVAHRLWREELGVAALVAACEGGHEGRTALDPLHEVVRGHVRITIRKVEHGQLRLCVTSYLHVLSVLKLYCLRFKSIMFTMSNYHTYDV